MTPTSREQFVQRARFVPMTPLGITSLIGGLAAVVGIVLLVSGDIGRWKAVGVLLAGAALMVGASILAQNNLRAEIKRAGFDAQAIREIEDEAERLNEKED